MGTARIPGAKSRREGLGKYICLCVLDRCVIMIKEIAHNDKRDVDPIRISIQVYDWGCGRE